MLKKVAPSVFENYLVYVLMRPNEDFSHNIKSYNSQYFTFFIFFQKDSSGSDLRKFLNVIKHILKKDI